MIHPLRAAALGFSGLVAAMPLFAATPDTSMEVVVGELREISADCSTLAKTHAESAYAAQCVKLCTRYADELGKKNKTSYSYYVRQCRGYLKMTRDAIAQNAQQSEKLAARIEADKKAREAQRIEREKQREATRKTAVAVSGKPAAPPTVATSSGGTTAPKSVPAAPPTAAPTAAPATVSAAIVRDLGFNAENPLVDYMFHGLTAGGDGMSTRSVFMIYVDVSHQSCQAKTPNGATKIEWQWTQESRNFYGTLLSSDTTTHFKWVDNALAKTFQNWQFTMPKEHSLDETGSIDGMMESMMRQIEPARAMRRDMQKIFANGCNSPRVRQMNENLSRAVRKMPSLQDDRDARLPMPLVMQEACETYVKSPGGDASGYRLSSCPCLAEQAGRKFTAWDKIAMRQQFDSIQLALFSHKAKSPGLLQKCMVADTRPGAKPQRAASPSVAKAPEGTEVGRQSTGSAKFQRPSAECEAAIDESFERAVGGDWCSVRRKDVPRIVAEMEKVNQGPLCQGRSGSAQAYKVEYLAPIRCKVQREGSPSEEEARLAERAMIGRKCLPVSDPDVESYVQFMTTKMSRSEARKHLDRVVPIQAADDGSMRYAKACAGNYLLSKWARN